MAKIKTSFFCNQCGGESPKWQGQCPHCKEWNTLIEEKFSSASSKSSDNKYSSYHGKTTSKLVNLSDIQTEEINRFSTNISEFDRVLGGGLVDGAVILIGGDPGIGKSTLLLQTLSSLASEHKVMYVSGEESANQIALRTKRLGLSADGIQLLTEIELESIINNLQTFKPRIAVIDSIQTLYSQHISSAPGSVSQVKECASQLTRIAKQENIVILLVGHVTKDGHLAGPRVLEHIVDTVLYFEGDQYSSFRLIRAFKNRFGAVNELGVFAMTDKGLKCVNNPSALFLSHHTQDISGSCIMVTQEGTRQLLVEIQALVDATPMPNPKRLSLGLEQNRLSMLLAVLHKHAGIACFNQDVFINAVGGVKINEPAIDIPVLLAICSSLLNRPLPKKLVAFGEIGLAGEIRPSPKGQERLKEAAKLGFNIALIPAGNMPKTSIEGLEIVPLQRIEDMTAFLRKLS
ncbi:MAG: repair protein RadA [Pseudomonadota bacterium]|jgi:DNA repair protein RadA/Sms